MQDAMRGVFHLHSTYSHDGRSTLGEIASVLAARGFSFCIVTDHFEDFDESKFDDYIRETRAVTERTGFILVPGVEVNLSGLDTILFPAPDYQTILNSVRDDDISNGRLYKVLAHASKYPYEQIVKHLQKYQIQGIEIWNQQVDGSHMPPFKLLQMFEGYSRRNKIRYLFGSDLHNVNLTVANTISLSSSQPTIEAIAGTMAKGDFASRNRPTGIEYCNGSKSMDFDIWLRILQNKSYPRGKLLGGVRSGLKSVYKMLPRHTQRSLNDVKNFIRNKV